LSDYLEWSFFQNLIWSHCLHSTTEKLGCERLEDLLLYENVDRHIEKNPSWATNRPFAYAGPILSTCFLHTAFIATGLPDGWHIFNPKILIWVNLGGTCNGRRWIYFLGFGSILRPLGKFCVH
jgi:hypothetical protein